MINRLYLFRVESFLKGLGAETAERESRLRKLLIETQREIRKADRELLLRVRRENQAT